ncbi:hypothetical protein [Coleofasciculus sp. FACHB-1120]|uniref:hypothetical protein n=1 Tax=Coleofasciculus sp. FACHB-1120 TaxID=2692783 RepID=UPI0016827984|nr:hypothetical protein [Coleofasciculus sp. FACHB-1120]MBD2742529.1 hypothetical protein [Coleofasciculus sp. FACHB-1120]
MGRKSQSYRFQHFLKSGQILEAIATQIAIASGFKSRKPQILCRYCKDSEVNAQFLCVFS